MATIQIFDPALCCSTGVCGVKTDRALVTFAADVDWAKQNGVEIERFLYRRPFLPVSCLPLAAHGAATS